MKALPHRYGILNNSSVNTSESGLKGNNPVPDPTNLGFPSKLQFLEATEVNVHKDDAQKFWDAHLL
jgi:hypothetical protein